MTDTLQAAATPPQPNTEERHCKCDLCVRHRRVVDISARGDVGEMRGLIAELEDELGNTLDDVDYNQAVMSGSWPSAVEQLTEALERAKKYRADHPEDAPDALQVRVLESIGAKNTCQHCGNDAGLLPGRVWTTLDHDETGPCPKCGGADGGAR